MKDNNDKEQRKRMTLTLMSLLTMNKKRDLEEGWVPEKAGETLDRYTLARMAMKQIWTKRVEHTRATAVSHGQWPGHHAVVARHYCPILRPLFLRGGGRSGVEMRSPMHWFTQASAPSASETPCFRALTLPFMQIRRQSTKEPPLRPKVQTASTNRYCRAIKQSLIQMYGHTLDWTRT
jgi:hypothetical protein